MSNHTIPAKRSIIEDFQKEIFLKRSEANNPPIIIPFRTDVEDKRARPVWNVPIELLRFRKDNGRIASDVSDYEKVHGPLSESELETQKHLEEFLKHKDPEKSKELELSIHSDAQRNPAIITCDGFLIDGNRRKMTMEKLKKDNPGNPKFEYMKVVFLPGPDDAGGPPTIFEIEKLENKLQLQSDGKSEYYGFDRAISIKRKIGDGLSLDEQLRDDPQYKNLPEKEFEKKKRDYEKEFLIPLECAERYLTHIGKDGQYHLVSKGKTDKDGRWQAFKDYSKLYSMLTSPSDRAKLGVEEDEIGELEAAAFNLIRTKEMPNSRKLHEIMRDLKEMLRTAEGKEEIKDIGAIPSTVTIDDLKDKSLKEASDVDLERAWLTKNRETIYWKLNKALKRKEHTEEREVPLDLLDAAYKKLTHKMMNLDGVGLSDLKKIRELASEIAKEAKSIEREASNKRKEIEENAKSIGKPAFH
jgi:hypothetical protein